MIRQREQENHCQSPLPHRIKHGGSTVFRAGFYALCLVLLIMNQTRVLTMEFAAMRAGIEPVGRYGESMHSTGGFVEMQPLSRTKDPMYTNGFASDPQNPGLFHRKPTKIDPKVPPNSIPDRVTSRFQGHKDAPNAEVKILFSKISSILNKIVDKLGHMVKTILRKKEPEPTPWFSSTPQHDTNPQAPWRPGYTPVYHHPYQGHVAVLTDYGYVPQGIPSIYPQNPYYTGPIAEGIPTNPQGLSGQSYSGKIPQDIHTTNTQVPSRTEETSEHLSGETGGPSKLSIPARPPPVIPTPSNQDALFQLKDIQLLSKYPDKNTLTPIEVLPGYLQTNYIEMDGNCLFRAFAFHLFGDQERHPEVRATLVRYIRSRPEKFAHFISAHDIVKNPKDEAEEIARLDSLTPEARLNEYCDYMATDRVFGDHHLIHVFKDVYDKNLVVVSRAPNYITAHFFSKKPLAQKADYQWVGIYLNNRHYEILYKDA